MQFVFLIYEYHQKKRQKLEVSAPNISLILITRRKRPLDDVQAAALVMAVEPDGDASWSSWKGGSVGGAQVNTLKSSSQDRLGGGAHTPLPVLYQQSG